MFYQIRDNLPESSKVIWFEGFKPRNKRKLHKTNCCMQMRSTISHISQSQPISSKPRQTSTIFSMAKLEPCCQKQNHIVKYYDSTQRKKQEKRKRAQERNRKHDLNPKAFFSRFFIQSKEEAEREKETTCKRSRNKQER